MFSNHFRGLNHIVQMDFLKSVDIAADRTMFRRILMKLENII